MGTERVENAGVGEDVIGFTVCPPHPCSLELPSSLSACSPQTQAVSAALSHDSNMDAFIKFYIWGHLYRCPQTLFPWDLSPSRQC